MLVEIILAFVLAMTIIYFITELTIRVKNKNEDLLVRTLTATDQAIIYNMVMSDVYNNGNAPSTITCSSAKVVEYKSKKLILNDYVNSCEVSGKILMINVKQLPGENFNVVLPD